MTANKRTYSISTSDGRLHQVDENNIKKYGIGAYAESYEGATIRMRDKDGGDYDIPLIHYDDAISHGLHPFILERHFSPASSSARSEQEAPQPQKSEQAQAQTTDMATAQADGDGESTSATGAEATGLGQKSYAEAGGADTARAEGADAPKAQQAKPVQPQSTLQSQAKTATSPQTGQAPQQASQAVRNPIADRNAIERMKREEQARKAKNDMLGEAARRRKEYEEYQRQQAASNAAGRANADRQRAEGIVWEDPAYRAELDSINPVYDGGDNDADKKKYALQGEGAQNVSAEGFGGKKIRVYDMDGDERTPYYARARVMNDPEDITRVVGKVDRMYSSAQPGQLPDMTVTGVAGGLRKAT